MKHRFIEAEDFAKQNHGKFSLLAFQSAERSYKSEITGGRLLDTLKPVTRFGGKVTTTTLFVLDLQTQEGMMFDPAQTPEVIRRRFLVHPLHVCILYFPLLMHLQRHQSEIWNLPSRIVIRDPLDQPGVLVDRAGRPVVNRYEWSARGPLAARLRNRSVPVEEDGQAQVTVEETAETDFNAPPILW